MRITTSAARASDLELPVVRTHLGVQRVASVEIEMPALGCGGAHQQINSLRGENRADGCDARTARGVYSGKQTHLTAVGMVQKTFASSGNPGCCLFELSPTEHGARPADCRATVSWSRRYPAWDAKPEVLCSTWGLALAPLSATDPWRFSVLVCGQLFSQRCFSG